MNIVTMRLEQPIYKLKIGKQFQDGCFTEKVMADLAAIDLVRANNDLVVDVLCKKNIRYVRCLSINKGNYERQTIRTGVILTSGSKNIDLDFFKQTMS